MSRTAPWCCSPFAHQSETRVGQNPTHPRGDRPVDSAVAAYLTRQYLERTGSEQVVFNDDDRLCRTCYSSAKAYIDDHPSDQFDDSLMSIGETPVRRSLRIAKLNKATKNRRYDEKSSSTESSSESSGSEMSREHERFQRKRSHDMLNKIFQVVGVSAVVDE